MTNTLRVALFTDSFHELNGVGTLSREFVSFTRNHNLAFCCVHAGPTTRAYREGSLLQLELKRSAASFPLDEGLYCDPLLSRYRNRVLDQLRSFDPDIIHITGPGDMGVLGFWVSNNLKRPMAASWHTNLHEYASRRLEKVFSFAPCSIRNRVTSVAERQSLRALMSFYAMAHFVFAPNAAMVEMLQASTRRPSYLMSHGVDFSRFSPTLRAGKKGPFCIGYVGRLTPEKNVRYFAELERRLVAAGHNDFRMLLVGDGCEREWLRKNLHFADLPGVLEGDSLAAAFAGMDAFVFPSATDTFGLVVLEAMASGVPVIVKEQTGARVQVCDGVAGFVADDLTDGVMRLMNCVALRRSMGEEARRFAVAKGWSSVFEDVYRNYDLALTRDEVRRRMNPRVAPSKAAHAF
ncbi:MAG: glycosyltransferase [Bryobacteraceae bacterium]|nr:glycosyltransferase [Bryobacteraceae bacterium]